VAPVPSDSDADEVGHQKQKTVPLRNVIDFLTATKVAERLSPQEFGNKATFTIFANREARTLYPGRVIAASGLPFQLRVAGVTLDSDSGKVKLSCLPDVFDHDVSSFIGEDGGGQSGGGVDSADDVAFAIFEVPAYLTPGQIKVTVVRIRGNNLQQSAEVWASVDDQSYVHVGNIESTQTGGTLDEDMLIDGKNELEIGPTFTPEGEDIDTVPVDLTGNEAAWGAGKQVLLFEGSDEVCFLKRVFPFAGNHRLEGVLRGQYGTDKEDHLVGDRFFVLNSDAAFAFSDPVLEPGLLLFVKVVSVGGGEVFPISEVVAVQRALIGKGVVPEPVSTITTTNYCRSWIAGASLDLVWNHRNWTSPGTGSGGQSPDQPHGPAPPMGTFQVIFLDASDVEKGNYFSSVPSYSYSNAQMVLDFGGEPSSIRVEVYDTFNGRTSLVRKLTVTKT